eukprot:2982465-Pleurochrysis_carterae.AAC.2
MREAVQSVDGKVHLRRSRDRTARGMEVAEVSSTMRVRATRWVSASKKRGGGDDEKSGGGGLVATPRRLRIGLRIVMSVYQYVDMGKRVCGRVCLYVRVRVCACARVR